MAKLRRYIGRIVRSELYHAFWLVVYGILLVATVYDVAMWVASDRPLVLANSVALVFALSLETAIATHAGAWSAELAAENNSNGKEP